MNNLEWNGVSDRKHRDNLYPYNLRISRFSLKIQTGAKNRLHPQHGAQLQPELHAFRSSKIHFIRKTEINQNHHFCWKLIPAVYHIMRFQCNCLQSKFGEIKLGILGHAKAQIKVRQPNESDQQPELTSLENCHNILYNLCVCLNILQSRDILLSRDYILGQGINNS